MLHGLSLVWSIGTRNINCYADSMDVLTLINALLSHFHKYVVLVQDICDSLQREWIVVLRHTLRQGNQCADYMAKLGASEYDRLRIHAYPPQDLSCLLLADSTGVAFPRG